MLTARPHLTIGELCEEFGVTARALRFYEDEALIPRVYRDCRFAVISPSTRDDLIARGIALEERHQVGGDELERSLLLGGQQREQPLVPYRNRADR